MPEGGLHGVPDGRVVQPVVVNTLLYVQLHLLESGLLFDVDRLELLLGKVSLREMEKFTSRPHRDVMKTTPDSEKYAQKNGKQRHGYQANSLGPKVACPTELFVKRNYYFCSFSFRYNNLILKC